MKWSKNPVVEEDECLFLALALHETGLFAGGKADFSLPVLCLSWTIAMWNKGGTELFCGRNKVNKMKKSAKAELLLIRRDSYNDLSLCVRSALTNHNA